MPKVKLSDEEFDEKERELENDKRHAELLSTVKAIANRDSTAGLEIALARQSQHLAQLLREEGSSRLAAELKPLIQELLKSVNDLKTALKQKPLPTNLRVQRDKSGLIERVVVEKLSGN